MYTVKRLSDLAGISVRTLHYYDEIDLLKPTHIGANGYRHYDDEALLRLQQILFYRELGLELMEIKEVLDNPDFDVLAALDSHKAALHDKITRLENLVKTVDETVLHLRGGKAMSRRKLFRAFTEEEQKYNERLVRLEHGPQNVNDSIRRWNSYSKEQQQAVFDEANDIYNDLADALEEGLPVHSEIVQEMIGRWHQNMHHFFDPTLDVLRGLGDTYATHPGFRENIGSIHPDLPDFLQQAITLYVDELETEEIMRMLAEDEQKSSQQ